MISALANIQSETMEVLARFLKPGTRAALVDFPNHRNHGDHLIFLGQCKYLDELNVTVDYIADPTRYDPSDLEQRVPEGPILLNGGGNFGDRWRETQKFRERVISDFPHRRIVQLSQGVEFSPGPLLEEAQRVYGAHPNLTLLIRDHDGVALTTQLFPHNNVAFCPDMALGNGKIGCPDPVVDLIYLRRRDSESVAARGFQLPGNRSSMETDWGFNAREELTWMFFHLPGAIARRLPFLRRMLYPIQHKAYFAIAHLNVTAATRILSHGGVVVTDRLHATVLASLMGKPVIALDNANGKIAAIAHDYLGEMPDVHYFSRLQEAEEFTKTKLETASGK